MAQRKEPPDSLDYFPTPPWATRALCELIMPVTGIATARPYQTVWEPACGEGDMARPLGEYFANVIASDIFDYGYGRSPVDFLGDERPPVSVDWIITNPPFRLTKEFVLKALSITPNVAILARASLLEGVDRYRSLFEPHKLHVYAPFSERVGMFKGRLLKSTATATAYAWFVWSSPSMVSYMRHIPPGTKARLDRPEDWRRAGVNAEPLPLMDAAAE